MVFDRSLFSKIAQHPAPETFPPNVYVAHTEHTITIFDSYPKADYHFLVIPRVAPASRAPGKNGSLGTMTPGNLMSLKTFFHSPGVDGKKARAFLLQMKEDAEALRAEVEEDMMLRRGVVMRLHFGFHALQSME